MCIDQRYIFKLHTFIVYTSGSQTPDGTLAYSGGTQGHLQF